MGRKNAQPALYELIRRRGDEPTPPPTSAPQQQRLAVTASKPSTAAELSAHDGSRDNRPVLGEWITRGRSVRVPIGYFFVAAATIVALAVLAYVVGHSSGERQAKTALDQAAIDEFNAGQVGRSMNDPLGRAPTRTGPDTPAGAAGARGGDRPDGNRIRDRIGDTAGPVESDPREVGTNYYYLVYTTRTKALEFAGFCRENGLEAYVVQGDNPELRRVMVLPGFASGQSSSPETRRLQERIKVVILQWKLKTSNREVLAYYPEKFKG